jgi:HAE1 family hydrophobic/amphiphilic exporter-1
LQQDRAARSTIGFIVLGGMVAATLLAIFVVPVLFVVICKISYGNQPFKNK